MSARSVDRRNFSRLSLAAVGGLVAGSRALAQEPPPIVDPIAPPLKPAVEPTAPKNDRPAPEPKEEEYDEEAELAKRRKERAELDKKKKAKDDEKNKEIHVCRGLNTCAGKGASGENKCAGQGDCATTLTAPHECATGNACKNQGGCGPTAGRNQCAGYGDGSVPILEDEWPRLRREFEQKMTRLKRKFGKAPLSAREVKWIQRKEEADAKAIAEMEAAAAEAELAKKNGTTKDDKKKPKGENKQDSADALDDITGGNKRDGKK